MTDQRSQPTQRALSQRLRPYLPNRSARLALVSLADKHPFRAHWPLALTQIVGGKTWSLSLIRYTAPGPVSTETLIRDRQTPTDTALENLDD